MTWGYNRLPTPRLSEKELARRIAEEEHILVVLLAGFGLIFLLDLPARAHRQRQLARPDGRVARSSRTASRAATRSRSTAWVRRGRISSGWGIHSCRRDLRPRRVRVALDRDGGSRRRGRSPSPQLLLALLGAGSEGDLVDVPACARRRAVGVVDPCADAGPPAVHRPPLARRHGGTEAVAAGLAGPAAARRLGQCAGSVALGALLVCSSARTSWSAAAAPRGPAARAASPRPAR